jgi:hypothetical protein
MLYYETVAPETLGLLRNIQKITLLSQTRLVGGTALALQYGHRESIDLDFFGVIDINPEQMKTELQAIGSVETISTSNAIRIFKINNVKTDFVNYHYKWLKKPVIIDDLILADVVDIAAMKLSAVTNRGKKKDFIDIFYILKQYSLKEIIDFYLLKYDEKSPFFVLKSIIYFEDAEDEPMPETKENISWESIKETIRDAVRSYELK